MGKISSSPATTTLKMTFGYGQAVARLHNAVADFASPRLQADLNLSKEWIHYGSWISLL